MAARLAASIAIAFPMASSCRSLPEGIATALAGLVRSVKCQHDRNLIEGHDTHPVEITRALNKYNSADLKKRSKAPLRITFPARLASRSDALASFRSSPTVAVTPGVTDPPMHG